MHADRRDDSSVAVPAGTGSNLTTSSSGGVAGVFTDDAAALAIATEIAENEIAHVRYLRAALGSAAVRLCCKAAQILAGLQVEVVFASGRTRSRDLLDAMMV